MFKREADQRLRDFGSSSPHKCLMVRGAGRVGKTWSVRKLGGSDLFDSFIEVNFLEQPELKRIFSGNLDVKTLLLNFSIYMPGHEFIPGRTLLFLDEIQECPEAMTSLKFWAEDGRFRVIAGGSMAGINRMRPSSYPVDSVEYLDMKPLGFREFLWALGIREEAISVLEDCFHNGMPVQDAIHEQMMKYLRLYMVVGGMPEVVQFFIDHNNMQKVDALQRALLKDYRNDITRFAPPTVRVKAEQCYLSLKDQLGKENHKFQYFIVEHGGTKRKFGSALNWLCSTDLVTTCHKVSRVESPLEAFAGADDFHLYPADIGMLTAMYDDSLRQMLLDDADRTDPALRQVKNAMAEALAACMLTHRNNRELFYYRNDTTKTRMEFLLSSADGVIPVEVKARNSRSRSLDRILDSADIPYGYKLTSGNIDISGKKRTMPLYMAMFL